MKIIVRCCGERTENKCIRLAERQGEVHVVRDFPFGKTIRNSYKLAIELNQKWIPMIDADVLLIDGTLEKAIAELNMISQPVFCLDGKTKDKIMMKKRRAGIHVYRTSLLKKAMMFIDNSHIKPETNVRKKMIALGYPTHQSGIIFGLHDYEQYYQDLWRKAVCQTQKLAGMIKRKPKLLKIWKRKALSDPDYLVIYHAHLYGKRLKEKLVIDARKTYSAKSGINMLKLREKGELK